MTNYVMGIDVSTQSISIVILEINIQDMKFCIVFEHSIGYTDWQRLLDYGIDSISKLLPSKYDGEANQPPLMFLDALDLILTQTQKEIAFDKVNAISISAQQHGHVYLNNNSIHAFGSLQNRFCNKTLPELFSNSFSYAHSPIWMTSAAQKQADEIRDYIGGSDRMMALSGSDSPARFTGAVIRRIGQRYADTYSSTYRIHLLSSFISGVLAGREDAPIDWGNGSGMSLMDYRNKTWAQTLLEAVTNDLCEKNTTYKDLYKKLPTLVSPLEVIGKIAPYFVNKYGFNADCQIATGSGDNPQTKVAIAGDLLSLGSSFVIMSNIDDTQKIPMNVNAMYDGLGQSFVFGCRTNGALVWDRVRNNTDFNKCEKILQKTAIGDAMLIWQPLAESFPVSPRIDAKSNFSNVERDYPAIIDTSLAIMHNSSKLFMKKEQSIDPLYVTGGPSSSIQILHRIAAFWNRPVIQIGHTGAAFGAALSAYVAFQSTNHTPNQTSILEIIDYIHHHIVPHIIVHSPALVSSPEHIEKAENFELKVMEKYKDFL